ncbi:uncharacterized protein G2W53_000566 [Senna tora]|uniref:Uncharacterized protein n=1 Tax=Senna tora TaxID=362788 RepID=A0A835CJK7_9FABA|nr:uncharacterized protein G2W53_000566 [Senna tora]
MVLAGEHRRCYEHRAKKQASKSIFHLLRLVRFALDEQEVEDEDHCNDDDEQIITLDVD